MKKSAEQKVTVGDSGSVGSITQIMRFGIPTILILAVIFIAITQMTGYDLKPAIDTILYGATPTPSYPICTVTIIEDSCLWIYQSANQNSERYGCLRDGAKIQVTGIADPYYEISSYGIESVFVYEDRGLYVSWVYAGSPAEAAGLQTGDIVLRMNDTPVTEIPDPWTYAVNLVGQQISILIKRDGQEKTLLVTPLLPEGYPDKPIGYSYHRINPNGLEANRGYVLGYAAFTPGSLKGQISMESYVSCQTQLIQPSILDDK